MVFSGAMDKRLANLVNINSLIPIPWNEIGIVIAIVNNGINMDRGMKRLSNPRDEKIR